MKTKSAMFRNVFSILSIFVLLVAGIQAGRAQDDGKFALQNPGFQEFFREAANISGAVVRGLQVQGRATGGPSLVSYVPHSWRGSAICARVVSADGRYEAYGTYLVPATWSGGSGALDFPTAYGELLRSVEADGIGVMVSKGDCGAQKTEGLSVVLWNSEAIETINMLVNSFNADEVFAYVGENVTPLRCERIESIETTNMIAYDRKCNISPASHAGPTKVEIYRLNHGKPSEPVVVTIWFPGI